MAVKAYSYIRFSTPEQAHGDSLRRQLTAARKWCEDRGIELDDSLRDLGVSAYHGRNRTEGALRSFLSLVESGEISRGSYLVIESLDRLSREAVLDAIPRLLDLIRAGIVVVTLADGQIYSEDRLRTDWTPLIVSIAIMARAHDESRMKGERVGAAWKTKKALAAIERKPITRRCPAWLRVAANGEFEVIEDRVDLIQRVFEETASGIGAATIARRLNEEGVDTWGVGRQQADGWHASYIKKLLSGDAVLGIYQPHEKVEGRRVPAGDPIKGYFPEVIDEGLYLRAQRAREDRQHGGGRRGRLFSNLLTGGLAKCAECGRTMVFVDKGRPPRGGQYLTCIGAKRGLCENHTHFAYPEIERVVLAGVVEIDLSRIIKDPDRKELTAFEDEIAIINKKIDDTKRKRKNLLAAFADSADADAFALIATFATDIQTLTAERDEKSKQLRKLSDGKAEMTAYVSQIDRLSSLMGEADDAQRYEIRAQLNASLKKVIQVIRFKKNRNVDIQLRQSGIWYIWNGTALTPVDIWSTLAWLDKVESYSSAEHASDAFDELLNEQLAKYTERLKGRT